VLKGGRYTTRCWSFAQLGELLVRSDFADGTGRGPLPSGVPGAPALDVNYRGVERVGEGDDGSPLGTDAGGADRRAAQRVCQRILFSGELGFM